MRNKADYPEPWAHSFSISDVIKTNESRIVQDIYNEVKKPEISILLRQSVLYLLTEEECFGVFLFSPETNESDKKGLIN